MRGAVFDTHEIARSLTAADLTDAITVAVRRAAEHDTAAVDIATGNRWRCPTCPTGPTGRVWYATFRSGSARPWSPARSDPPTPNQRRTSERRTTR